jgi:hypothetical protein
MTQKEDAIVEARLRRGLAPPGSAKPFSALETDSPSASNRPSPPAFGSEDRTISENEREQREVANQQWRSMDIARPPLSAIMDHQSSASFTSTSAQAAAAAAATQSPARPSPPVFGSEGRTLSENEREQREVANQQSRSMDIARPPRSATMDHRRSASYTSASAQAAAAAATQSPARPPPAFGSEGRTLSENEREQREVANQQWRSMDIARSPRSATMDHRNSASIASTSAQAAAAATQSPAPPVSPPVPNLSTKPSSEEAQRREEEARSREQEMKRKEDDSRKAEVPVREEGTRTKEDEARRQAKEAKRRKEARRREEEVKAKEAEVTRKEAEMLRRERELRDREDEIRRKVEATRRAEEEVQAARRAEEMQRKEQELREREELRRREAAVQREAEIEMKRKERELREHAEALQREESERQRKAKREEDMKRREEEEAQRKQREEERRRAREAIEQKKKEGAAVAKSEKTNQICGSDVEYNSSQLKKGETLPCVPETLTDSEADRLQSRLSGSGPPYSSASSGQELSLQLRQTAARIIKDPTVLDSAYMKTPASSEFRYTYAKSISSSQTTTSTSSTRHLRAYYGHKRQWDRLPTEKYLKWDMFPWPVLQQPATVDDITANAVEEYLDSLYQLPQNLVGSMEEYVIDHIDRWNYDRMDAKVFGRVHIGHRKKVEEGVIRVGGILQAILRSIQESR